VLGKRLRQRLEAHGSEPLGDVLARPGVHLAREHRGGLAGAV